MLSDKKREREREKEEEKKDRVRAEEDEITQGVTYLWRQWIVH